MEKVERNYMSLIHINKTFHILVRISFHVTDIEVQIEFWYNLSKPFQDIHRFRHIRVIIVYTISFTVCFPNQNTIGYGVYLVPVIQITIKTSHSYFLNYNIHVDGLTAENPLAHNVI